MLKLIVTCIFLTSISAMAQIQQASQCAPEMNELPGKYKIYVPETKIKAEVVIGEARPSKLQDAFDKKEFGFSSEKNAGLKKVDRVFLRQDEYGRGCIFTFVWKGQNVPALRGIIQIQPDEKVIKLKEIDSDSIIKLTKID